MIKENVGEIMKINVTEEVNVILLTCLNDILFLPILTKDKIVDKNSNKQEDKN